MPKQTKRKRTVPDLNATELLSVVNALCMLDKANLLLVESFLSPGNKVVFKKYMKAVESAMSFEHGDRYTPEEIWDFDKLEQVLLSYRLSTNDDTMLAALYTFATEESHAITMNLGDIDEDYYHSMGKLYEDTCKIVADLKQNKTQMELISRLKKIHDESQNIGWGWGYGFDLDESYSRYLADRV